MQAAGTITEVVYDSTGTNGAGINTSSSFVIDTSPYSSILVYLITNDATARTYYIAETDRSGAVVMLRANNTVVLNQSSGPNTRALLLDSRQGSPVPVGMILSVQAGTAGTFVRYYVIGRKGE
jgi:hypothetical protein